MVPICTLKYLWIFYESVLLLPLLYYISEFLNVSYEIINARIEKEIYSGYVFTENTYLRKKSILWDVSQRKVQVLEKKEESFKERK